MTTQTNTTENLTEDQIRAAIEGLGETGSTKSINDQFFTRREENCDWVFQGTADAQLVKTIALEVIAAREAAETDRDETTTVVVAIGDDGTRPVIWGAGVDADAAEADALHWLAENESESDLQYARVSAARAPQDGLDIDASDLTEAHRDGWRVRAEFQDK